MKGEMAAKTEAVDEFIDENTNRSKTLPPISSVLRLDSIFDEKSDLHEVFELTELKNVIDLSMKDNCLSKLPENFGQNLSNLTKINLSYNNILKLDICVKTLINLEELIVDKNGLKELPDSIGELYNLRLISAKGNRLKIIPKSFGNLVGIEELDFSDNRINNITDSWAKLNNLKIVNLSYNELRSVPNCVIQGSPRLEILDLSRNYISEFNSPPLSNNLRRLYLNNNSKNDQFPVWLLTEKFSSLEELILDETVFVAFDIPDSKNSPLSHLRKLSMIHCGLSDTDFESISQSMINLEYLNLGNTMTNRHANIFWVMPAKNFKNHYKLEELNIQRAGLPAVPQEVNMLGNLTRLNISQNNISSLPEEICELTRLEFLNAACNNLYALPRGLGNLTALKILFLETNRLSSLPDSIENLEHLECLDLYNNEFLEVPKQLERIRNLKALDIDGNVFKTENLQIDNIKYQKAKNILRSTSNLLLLRSDNPKVLDEVDYKSIASSLEYEEDNRSSENKELIDPNLSDIESEENWSISEDSADEYDPTVSAKPRTYMVPQPFSVSSFYYYGNFCPADLHSKGIRQQLAAMQRKQGSSNFEEGQFDDA